MAKSIYFINPKEVVPGYYGMEVTSRTSFGAVTLVADLATTTLAAMAPDDWQVRLCDERAAPVDLDSDAAIIGITGKISQRDRMIALADHFRDRGQRVVIGGPYATLSPEDVRSHCDILVTGEVEEIAPELFAALDAGTTQKEFAGGQVDLSSSPIPRWDIYPSGRALSGTLQTSRGCPFQCEFCDVIQYAGRKQRHKPVANVLAELDFLYRNRYRSVFLADDNFTVYRKRAKELLEALRDWNKAHRESPVWFNTQLSVDAAREEDLLELCAAANLRGVFIGIESPSEESLLETKKRQNLKVDLVEEVTKFVKHGIAPTCGIIVGFDADGPGVFETLHTFIKRLPVPILTIGALVAPPKTPLYARMKEEGRLVGSDHLGAGDVFQTNIVPKQMSQDELLAGIRRLCKAVYAPAAFEQRIMHFMAIYGSRAPDPRPFPRRLQLDRLKTAVIRTLLERGEEERRMCRRLFHVLQVQPPDVRGTVITSIVRYAQIRHMYDAMDKPPKGASVGHGLSAVAHA